MKLLGALLFTLFSAQLWAVEAKLESYELVATYTLEDLKVFWKKTGVPEFIAPLSNGIEVYEVIYQSTWIDSSPIKASGLYFVPQGKHQNLPLIIYHHGTQIEKDRKIRLGGEQGICVGFAADGYAVLMPDYFGLGKGEKKHLYIHAETEALAAIDMHRSIKELNAKEGITWSDKLFITGYSQGGHAAMATHMVMERDYPNEFHVTASAPMSGPYDVSGDQGSVMFNAYSHPGYLPYLIYSYQEVYNLVPDINKIFKSPYDSILPPMFDGNHSMGEINKLLPGIPKDMMSDEVIEAFLKDTGFIFRVALRKNDVYNWKPEAPVLLCYCKGDEQVSYKNSVKTEKAMKANGAKNVRLKHCGKKFTHGTCALYTVIFTKMWFDSFVDGSAKGRKGPVLKRMLVNVSKVKMLKAQKKRQQEREGKKL
ncbi:hypothetical protein BH09BAC1_BH09BAC1_29820 [soil metagenome]